MNRLQSSKKIDIKPIGFVKMLSKRESIKHDGGISKIVVREGLIDALQGIEDFSHLFIIFWMHKTSNEMRSKMKSHPRGKLDMPLLGVFSTRTPHRPNPIGLTIVDLLSVERNVLTVRNLDAFDCTPILNIKPFDYWDITENIRVPEWWTALKQEE